MVYNPLAWIQERIVRPTYRRVYKPPVERVRRITTRVQREAKQYVPTVSYKRAAERRAAIIRKIKKVKRKIIPTAPPPAPVGFQEKIVSQKVAALTNLESQYIKAGRIAPTGEFLPTSTINVERKYARDIMPTGEFKATHTDTTISKWGPYIRGQSFIGSKEQFTHYQSEFNTAQRKDKARYNAYKKDWGTAQQADKMAYGAYQSKFKEYEAERTKLTKLKAEKQKELKEFVTYPIYRETAKFGEWWEEKIVPKGLRPGIPTAIKPLAKFGVGIIRSPGQVVSFFGMVPSAAEYAVRDADEFAVSLVPGAVMAGKGMVKHAKEEPFVFVGEMAGMLALTYGVGKVVRGVKGKVVEEAKFYGKTEIPVEQIVKPEVIRGVTRFPVSKAPPRKLITAFEQTEYTQLAKIAADEVQATKAWHAAPKEFGKAGEVAIGESELPGLYTAPSLSPWFLRVSAKPKYKLLGLGLDKALKPSALLIKMKGIERLPKGIREKGFKGAREFMFEEAELGKGYITPKYERGWRVTPREEEAVIPPETPLTRTEFTKFLKWERKKIPIHEYAVEGSKGITRDIKAFEKAGEVSRRYGKEYRWYVEYREPIITPSRLARLTFLGDVIEEDMLRIPKEERAFTPFEMKEERPLPKVKRYEERRLPIRRREKRYIPLEEERRWILPPEERILEPVEDLIREYPLEEPPFMPEAEIMPREIISPPLKKRKKLKKPLKPLEEELEEIYRKRKYPTLTPKQMLKM